LGVSSKLPGGQQLVFPVLSFLFFQFIIKFLCSVGGDTGWWEQIHETASLAARYDDVIYCMQGTSIPSDITSHARQAFQGEGIKTFLTSLY
jgi:hypothetical protein